MIPRDNIIVESISFLFFIDFLLKLASIEASLVLTIPTIANSGYVYCIHAENRSISSYEKWYCKKAFSRFRSSSLNVFKN